MATIDYNKKTRIPKHSGEWNGYKCGSFGKDESRFWLRKFYPDLTYAEHLAIRDKMRKLYKSYEKQYSKAVDNAFMRTFGRKSTMLDYKISGIYSDKLSETDKEKIRGLIQKTGRAEDVCALHNSKLLAKDSIKRGEW